MTGATSGGEYRDAAYAQGYLTVTARQPSVEAGEAVLVSFAPVKARRLLDLGAGDGRLLARLLADRPTARGVALDFSAPMLAAARARLAGDERVELVEHDLNEPLPDLGEFDVIVSSFAIHHLAPERQRSLYAEVFARLRPGGIFANLEHVAAATEALHERFLREFGITREQEDPSNQCVAVETQLGWLRAIGFADVDCAWKWLELALLVGVKPVAGAS